MKMAYKIFGILLASFVCYVNGANPPHTTIPYYDHSESSQINFMFEPTLSHFITRTYSTCFLVKLTHDEIDHIHSSRGLGDLELKMMREWVGQLPETRIYHDDPNLPEYTRNYCSRHDMFLLERGETATQPSSILG
ncbi:uncharacterized protein LOC132740816 [Ruditapes philippinarum]|uniref:uncharacterized protein LOC132740816 n=1 Tax=Ruditapes philippinarum TaxID=129788 RepID=UPI00295B3321|nr:uncharacterized protein LOC132740816 [Ruditapes philippinarum]